MERRRGSIPRGKREKYKALKAVEDIHKRLIHKSKNQMLCAFRNAGKLDTETKKHIEKAPETCQIDKKNKRSSSKPLVSFEHEEEKGMDAKDNEQEKPEDVAIFAVEVPIE